MPTFSYAAINEMGQRVRGKIAADNDLDLEERLKQVKLDLITAKEMKEQKSSRFSRVKIKDLIIMCTHLEQLNHAGVPLHDALADVRDSSESAKLRDILTGVYESVKNGKMLSKSLEAYPKIFSSIFTGLISTGEKTGNLDESFKHLAEHLKWSSEIRRKVKKATRYPIVLVVMISIVISVLMIAVVPKLIDFIVSQGFSIPLHTRALIAFSYAFQNYWYLIFGIPILLVIGGMTLYRTYEPFAYKFDSIMLKMPMFGNVIRKINMARFTHFFSVMFNSGIDMLEALDGAKEVVTNRVLRDAIDLVRNNVMEGSSLAESLKMSTQFPNLVVRMFKVGEDSGNMSQALENINFFYTREVNDAVETMVGMIQPSLTVVMGIMIFWIIAAVFGPLYESFGKMKF